MIDLFDAYLELLAEREQGRDISDGTKTAYELSRIAYALEQIAEALAEIK